LGEEILGDSDTTLANESGDVTGRRSKFSTDQGMWTEQDEIVSGNGRETKVVRGGYPTIGPSNGTGQDCIRENIELIIGIRIPKSGIFFTRE
jgi:hypothetical protein